MREIELEAKIDEKKRRDGKRDANWKQQRRENE